MKKVLFGVFLLSFVHFGQPVLKIWKHDSDVLNPEHWEGGQPSKNCEGLDLRPATHSVLPLDQLKVKKILLPRFGNIYFIEGARIELDEEDQGELNCVRLKNNFSPYDWMNPNAWKTDGVGENPAVPHAERIPCIFDDVSFPKGWKSRQCEMNSVNFEFLHVRSFNFGGKSLVNTDLDNLGGSIPIISSNILERVRIYKSSCFNPSGCVCVPFANEVCSAMEESSQNNDCLDPFAPIGFCSKICGASISISTTAGDFPQTFKIQTIRDNLKGYSSYTHVSKVRTWNHTLQVQIIFTEDKFTGSSVDEARNFYSKLLSDTSFGAFKVTLLVSHVQINAKKVATITVSIIIGTLCGVLFVFGIIFFVNSPHFERLNLRSRPNFTSNPLSGLFAKYHKMEGLDRADSVISLQKSFDNPMYGTSEPSTATTSRAVVELEETPTKTEIELENPLFEIHSLNESADPGSGGSQLVSMTSLKDLE